MTSFIDAHNAEGLALLERIGQHQQRHAELRGRAPGRRGDCARELAALGFKTEWIDGAAWNRAGHLVATHAGTSQKILLIGHLDTVFDRESPFQKFERIDADTARGPGIIDMKGGDVIIIQSLKALKAAGLLDKMNVTVVMTGDEERHRASAGEAREALVTAAKGARGWPSASKTATANPCARSGRQARYDVLAA
jgi:glutamate carboxypeptidase